MKKYGVFAMAFAAAMLTGCGNKNDVTEQRADHIPPESSDSAVMESAGLTGVEVRTEQESYPPDVSEIRLHIRNNSDESIYLPEEFSLWYYYDLEGELADEFIPYADNGDSFPETAREVPEHGETDIMLDIAGHFDRPFSPEMPNSGFYRVKIGDLSADFLISEESEQPPQTQNELIMDAEQESYPAGTKEISVRIINSGASDLTFTNADIGMEQFLEGSVCMTPFSADSPAAQNGLTISSGDCQMWTLKIADFHGMELQAGEYAVCLAGCEAHFTVTE